MPEAGGEGVRTSVLLKKNSEEETNCVIDGLQGTRRGGQSAGLVTGVRTQTREKAGFDTRCKSPRSCAANAGFRRFPGGQSGLRQGEKVGCGGVLVQGRRRKVARTSFHQRFRPTFGIQRPKNLCFKV